MTAGTLLLQAAGSSQSAGNPSLRELIGVMRGQAKAGKRGGEVAGFEMRSGDDLYRMMMAGDMSAAAVLTRQV